MQMKLLVYVCFINTVVIATDYRYNRYQFLREYEEHNPTYYGRSEVYGRPKKTPLNIAEPLSMGLCSSPTYSGLRTCKMATQLQKKGIMKSISRKYFCKYKDHWFGDGRRDDRRRSRRAINQCGGTEIRRVLLQAYEANRPNVLRELVHDPGNHLYQTMFVSSCGKRKPVQGFQCRMHQIKFKAAVWSLNPSSNKITVMDVLVDGYCALTQL